jgi:hypothetical protein
VATFQPRASARAVGRGPDRCSSPVASAIASASSSSAQTSGSPRLRPHQPQHAEREDAWHRPPASIAQGEPGGVPGLVPAPAIELHAGAARDEEQPPQIEAVLGAMLEAVLEVAVDES